MELWIAAGFLAPQCALIVWDWISRKQQKKQLEKALLARTPASEDQDLRVPGLLQTARWIIDLSGDETSERSAQAQNSLKQLLGDLDLLLFEDELEQEQARAVYAYRLLILCVLDLADEPVQKQKSTIRKLLDALLLDPDRAADSGNPICAIALLLVKLSSLSAEELQKQSQSLLRKYPGNETLKDALYSLQELSFCLYDQSSFTPAFLPGPQA